MVRALSCLYFFSNTTWKESLCEPFENSLMTRFIISSFTEAEDIWLIWLLWLFLLCSCNSDSISLLISLIALSLATSLNAPSEASFSFLRSAEVLRVTDSCSVYIDFLRVVHLEVFLELWIETNAFYNSGDCASSSSSPSWRPSGVWCLITSVTSLKIITPDFSWRQCSMHILTAYGLLQLHPVPSIASTLYINLLFLYSICTSS